MSEPIAASARHALPFSVKLSHGTGSIANGSLLYLRSLILLFYSQVVGLDPGLVGLVMGASIIADAFWDPAIGHFSDNLRTRFGRRHLLMFIAPIPAAIMIALFWNPPTDLSPGMTLAWFAATLLLLNLCYSFFEVPATALTPELAPGYHERTGLVSWRWVMGTMGALLATVMGLGYFLAPDGENVGQLIRSGYGHLGIAVALLALFAMVINALGTRRYIGKLYTPSQRHLPVGESIREAIATLKNGNMAVAVLAGALAGIGFGIRSVLEAYIATYIWALPAAAFMWLALSGFAAAPFGALVAARTGRMFGKKAACMTLFFVGTTIVNLPLFLRMIDAFVPNGSPALLPTLTAFAFVGGVLNYGGFILVSSMIADIVEEAQARTGRRSEGLITAADSLIQKVITAIGTALGGLILTLIAFPRQAVPGQVSAETLDALGWWFLGLASILSFFSIATWKFYTIDQTAHEDRLRALGMADVEATTV